MDPLATPHHRTCNCSACRSDLRIIWEWQLHRWHFCRLVKGVWYSRSYSTFEKLEIYGITGANVAWFRCYLTNRKQYICINNDKTNEQKVTCSVPQGSWTTLNNFDINKWSPQCLQFVKYYNVCKRYKPLFEHKDI